MLFIIFNANMCHRTQMAHGPLARHKQVTVAKNSQHQIHKFQASLPRTAPQIKPSWRKQMQVKRVMKMVLKRVKWTYFGNLYMSYMTNNVKLNFSVMTLGCQELALRHRFLHRHTWIAISEMAFLITEFRIHTLLHTNYSQNLKKIASETTFGNSKMS